MLAELEIAVDHFPTNFLHLAKQIQFARPNLLYISQGCAQVLKSGGYISILNL